MPPALKEMPVVVITRMRQNGKTTFLPIEAGRDCMAIEVTLDTRWQERDLSGLKAFLSVTPHCKAAILGYNGTDAVKLGDKLWALPLSLILT